MHQLCAPRKPLELHLHVGTFFAGDIHLRFGDLDSVGAPRGRITGWILFRPSGVHLMLCLVPLGLQIGPFESKVKAVRVVSLIDPSRPKP